MSDPNRHLRLLHAETADDLARIGEAPPDSTASFLGRVTVATALPTATGKFFMVHPVEVDGTDGEGDSPTLTDDADRTIPVVIIGAKVPAVGDYVEAYAVGGKWVASTGCGAIKDDDCPGGGTLCVTLTAVCTGNANGYTVIVKDHTTGAVVASGTTSVNTVCFTGVAPGFYDVTATRTNCNSLSWTNQEVTCGDTTTLTGSALCSTNAAIVFTVDGCHSHPLPDAVIVISGPDSGTITTGSDGKATFFTTHTGTFSFTITHPSGRFTTVTGTVIKGSLCVAASTLRTMSAATGYNCCAEFGALWAGVNPYPIPNTLYITDGKGFTAAITVNGTSCNGAVCSDRVMDNTSATNTLVSYTCAGGGIANMPPADIGDNSTALEWGLQLGGPGVLQLKQQHAMYATFNGLTYVAGGDVSHICSPQDTRRTWRVASACPYTGTLTYRSDTQATATINSVYPLNISFTFSGGLGFGPTAIGNNVDGQPYTTSATLHE